jgi:protein-tyrosine phosphatase
MPARLSVLFVCMGNICRSPTAEGVVQKLLDDGGLAGQIALDSAGTHAWHINEPPDPRAQEAAAKLDIDLSGLRARAVEPADFHEFDYIIAMDRDNVESLELIRPPNAKATVELMLAYASNASNTSVQEVPDPYYGGTAGFEKVVELLQDAGQGLLQKLQQS